MANVVLAFEYFFDNANFKLFWAEHRTHVMKWKWLDNYVTGESKLVEWIRMQI